MKLLRLSFLTIILSRSILASTFFPVDDSSSECAFNLASLSGQALMMPTRLVIDPVGVDRSFNIVMGEQAPVIMTHFRRLMEVAVKSLNQSLKASAKGMPGLFTSLAAQHPARNMEAEIILTHSALFEKSAESASLAFSPSHLVFVGNTWKYYIFCDRLLYKFSMLMAQSKINLASSNENTAGLLNMLFMEEFIYACFAHLPWWIENFEGEISPTLKPKKRGAYRSLKRQVGAVMAALEPHVWASDLSRDPWFDRSFKIWKANLIRELELAQTYQLVLRESTQTPTASLEVQMKLAQGSLWASEVKPMASLVVAGGGAEKELTSAIGEVLQLFFQESNLLLNLWNRPTGAVPVGGVHIEVRESGDLQLRDEMEALGHTDPLQYPWMLDLSGPTTFPWRVRTFIDRPSAGWDSEYAYTLEPKLELNILRAFLIEYLSYDRYSKFLQALWYFHSFDVVPFEGEEVGISDLLVKFYIERVELEYLVWRIRVLEDDRRADRRWIQVFKAILNQNMRTYRESLMKTREKTLAHIQESLVLKAAP